MLSAAKHLPASCDRRMFEGLARRRRAKPSNILNLSASQVRRMHEYLDICEVLSHLTGLIDKDDNLPHNEINNPGSQGAE